MDGHLGPAPACSRSHEPTAAWLRTGLGRPEPSYIPPDRRPGPRHPTGSARPRSLWLGTSQSKENDADLSGVERVDGGGKGEPNRDGPGSTKMCRYGKVALFTAIPHATDWDTAPLRDAPLQGKSCGRKLVRSDGNPNSSYNEYICYTTVLLCQ
jgi:hypothetical protein